MEKKGYNMKRNNLHSFTLWPKSSAIVQKIKRGRKSQFVSKAIIWYDMPAQESAQAHAEVEVSGAINGKNIGSSLDEVELFPVRTPHGGVASMRFNWYGAGKSSAFVISALKEPPAAALVRPVHSPATDKRAKLTSTILRNSSSAPCSA